MQQRVAPSQPQTQVEVSKLDEKPARPKPRTMEEILADAVEVTQPRFEAPKTPTSKEEFDAQQFSAATKDMPAPVGDRGTNTPVANEATPVEVATKKKRKKSTLDQAVPMSLIEELEHEHGIQPDKHKTVVLRTGKKPLKVGYRKIGYDDVIWGLSRVKQHSDSIDKSFIMGDGNLRQQFFKHQLTCRCVVSIKGHPIWEYHQMADQVKAVCPPTWDGVSVSVIPDYMQNILGEKTFDLFHRINPDLLFELDAVVHGIENQATAQDAEDDGEEEDPTSAA